MQPIKGPKTRLHTLRTLQAVYRVRELALLFSSGRYALTSVISSIHTRSFSRYGLAIVLLMLCAVPAFADTRTISWDELLPQENITFDDPFEKLTPRQLRDLSLVARIRWLTANKKSSPDGESSQEEQELIASLTRQGIDVEWLLSQREHVVEMRRKKLESVGEAVVGSRIRIAGYMMPLTTEQGHVTRFLLAPWLPPCSHLPPPPSNQTILVSMADGAAFRERLEPVWVEGTLHRKSAVYAPFLMDGTLNIEAMYSLDGTVVTDYSAKELGVLEQSGLPVPDSAHSWFVTLQMRIAILFTRAMTAIRDRHSSAPVWIGLLIAFAYGALHTLGPGHGKAVVISYFVGHGGSVKRGVRMGAQIAICHVLSAVVTVWLTNAIIRQATGQAPSDFRAVKLVSYAAIAGIGLFLLWQALRETLSKPAGHAHDSGHCSAAEHAGHHAGCSCASHSAQHAGPLGWLALAVGAIPCTGAILVLLFGMSNDLLGPAILMVMAMSLGMAIAMSGIGILAILGRNYASHRFIRNDALGLRVTRGIRVATAALIATIGLSLFSLTMLTDRAVPSITSTEVSSKVPAAEEPPDIESGSSYSAASPVQTTSDTL